MRVSVFVVWHERARLSCGKWSSNGSCPGSGRKSDETFIFGIQSREEFSEVLFFHFLVPGGLAEGVHAENVLRKRESS